MASPKWSRSMSWLHLPKKIQKLYAENLLAVSVDYEKYVVSDSTIVMRMIREMGFSWEIDCDNSNLEHSANYDFSLRHWRSDLWTFYEVLLNLPGFKPLQVFSFESYYHNRIAVLWAEGGIEFPGAFFRFKEIMKEQAPEIVHFYDRVRRLSNLSFENTKVPVFRRNRLDVAIDIKNVSVDQKWECEYIVPNKNSKKPIHHFVFRSDLGGWQSFSYLPPSNRGVGIRIYNKSKDIIDKSRQAWYPNIDAEKDTVTRIEIVYYSPYAENPDDVLLLKTQKEILWLDTWVTLCYAYDRPKSIYSPLTAHTYFTRYSKNHGKELYHILQDVLEIEESHMVKENKVEKLE